MSMKWYVVYTKPWWEKKVVQGLTKKGFENYCPLICKSGLWHDRKKIIYEPLFPFYVFVRTEEKRLYEIKAMDGIINLVYWLKKPAVISSDEIDAIRKFLNEYDYAEVVKIAVNVDDRVRIMNSVFINEEGNGATIKNKLVRVGLPSLGYILVADPERQQFPSLNLAWGSTRKSNEPEIELNLLGVGISKAE